MNKVILFIGICMVLGCSNRKEDYAPTNEIITKEKAPVAISLEDAYKPLILEKIQDHIDTQKLQDQYPNFKHSIDTIAPLYINHQETIQDIILLDTVDDDVSTKDIRAIITYTSSKKDTIIATIERTKVVLDGEEIISSKVILRTPKK